MQFEVVFRIEPICKCMHALYVDSRPVGISLVDQARSESGVPKLVLDRIPDETGEMHTAEYDVEVTEKFARRQADLFAETNSVTVDVPHKHLDKYHHLRTRFEKNHETGEVYGVYFGVMIDDGAILGDWEADGAPIRWGFEEKETE